MPAAATPNTVERVPHVRHPRPYPQTERLLLRPPATEDLDGFAAFADREATRFLGGPGPRAAAWRMLAAFAGSWALHGFGMFSVIERSACFWIGRVGPWRPEGWPGPEVGWGLLAAAQGRGYVPSIALARRLGSTDRGPGRLPAPFEDRTVDVSGRSATDRRARRGRRRLTAPRGAMRGRPPRRDPTRTSRPG